MRDAEPELFHLHRDLSSQPHERAAVFSGQPQERPDSGGSYVCMSLM